MQNATCNRLHLADYD